MINGQQWGNRWSTLLTVDPGGVDPLTVDCWSSPPESSQQCWLLIASLLTVDPITVDCWSLIASLLTVDPLTIDCWSSIASLLTIDPLTVDCWPSHCWLLILPPPWSQQCWLSITSLLTIGALCPEQWDLCAPQTFRAKHGLATSNNNKCNDASNTAEIIINS